MRRDSIDTLKFLGYIIFMPMFCLVGLAYKPLKWIVTKCSTFDKDYYEKTN